MQKSVKSKTSDQRESHFSMQWLYSFDCAGCFHVQHQIACLSRCIIALVPFVWLFPTVCLKMSPQRACLSRSEATLLEFKGENIVWRYCYCKGVKMDLKQENICLIFLSWNIWSAVFCKFTFNLSPKKFTSFLQAAAYLNGNLFKCVSSKSLLDRMQSHTGCICSTFLHYEFSNVFSNCLHEKIQNQISWIFL